MSEMGYVIWFIATAVITTGILVVLVMEAMGTFSHEDPDRRRPRTPREARQYWPHTGL
jgi:hypothetical protein